jgi:hypothetical protein
MDWVVVEAALRGSPVVAMLAQHAEPDIDYTLLATRNIERM